MHLHTADLAGRAASPLLISSGSTPPFTNPSLTANLICRVMLALTGNFICLVPLRLLHRNGEFAATVFILTVEIKNLQTIVNALIWRNDNVDQWWPGYGFCDAVPYLHNLTYGLYGTCMLAIIRNLAHQVGLLRAHPLTVKEKRKRNLYQALVIFPLPVLQVLMTWPLTAQRFAVGTLVGCTWVAYPSLPLLIVFIVPYMLVGVLTAFYAGLTYIRFRQATKSSETALSSNEVANQRAQRTKRRLYFMILCILTPYLPIILTIGVLNIIDSKTLKPYSYHAVHHHSLPYPWGAILFLKSGELGFGILNNPWISILTTVPVFIFFGMTKEALNDYRKVLLALKVDRFFGSLNTAYDPSRSGYSGSTLGSSTLNSSRSRKLATDNHTTSSRDSDHPLTRGQSLNFITSASSEVDVETGVQSRIDNPADNVYTIRDCHTKQPHSFQSSPQTQPPSPAAEVTPYSIFDEGQDTSRALPLRNPFLLRTNFDLPTSLFRFTHLNPWGRKSSSAVPGSTSSTFPESSTPLDILQPAREDPKSHSSSSNRDDNPAQIEVTHPSPVQPSPWRSSSRFPKRTRVQTNVWSSDPQQKPRAATQDARHRSGSKGSSSNSTACVSEGAVVIETEVMRESCPASARDRHC